MNLSKQQTKIIRAYAKAAFKHLVKKYELDYSRSATRVAFEVLSKLHFKVKPLLVEVKLYNDKYVAKGRNPKSEGEFQEWVKEGAWAQVMPNHLVPIINNNTMIDLQANMTDDGLIPPILCDVFEDFLTAQKPLFVQNMKTVMIYDAMPDEKSYLSDKEWLDKTATEQLVKEVYSETRDELRK